MSTTLARLAQFSPRITLPGILLRLEGVALFAAAVAIYAYLGASWWLFALLLFSPDLFALGYLAGPRAGSVSYNLVHTTSVPLMLGVVSVLGGMPLGVQLALIWLAHIGLDRGIGYGLKYPDTFKHTHLNEV